MYREDTRRTTNDAESGEPQTKVVIFMVKESLLVKFPQ